MKEELGRMTRYEIEGLMKKVSMERSKRIKEFVAKAYALEVGEEFFQCYMACLPGIKELRQLLNGDNTSTLRFKIWPTINGTMVKREA